MPYSDWTRIGPIHHSEARAWPARRARRSRGRAARDAHDPELVEEEQQRPSRIQPVTAAFTPARDVTSRANAAGTPAPGRPYAAVDGQQQPGRAA